MILADISWDTLGVALIVSVIAPSVVTWLAGRRRKNERAEAKADAKEARDLLQVQADKLLTRQAEQSAALLAATAVNTGEIQIIRKNSERTLKFADGQYTTLLRSMRANTAALVVSEQLLVAYREGTDFPPTDEDRRTITRGEADIKALDIEIAARDRTINAAVTEESTA